MNYFKFAFIAFIVIAAFVMNPKLGSELGTSCKQIKASIDNTSKQMQDSFQKAPPLIPPKNK